MRSVVRNAPSIPVVNAREVQAVLPQAHQAQQCHSQLQQPLVVQEKEDCSEEKLSVLPENRVNKHLVYQQQLRTPARVNQQTDEEVGKEMRVEEVKEESRVVENRTGNLNCSLLALSALCSPEAPNVIYLSIIRESLLGQVRLCSYALGNNEVLPMVVKEFNLAQVLNKMTKSGVALHEDALMELQIHAYTQQKQMRNVIGLYAMHLNLQSNRLYAYLEYAAKGDLFSIVQARGAAVLPLSLCGNFFVQLLHGIDGLHSINVVHRDLSLENVLLTQDNEIKICDFGLAAICVPGATVNDGVAMGKVKYMCPEVYSHEEYDARLVDIWSAAVIFFLMLTGIFPYERPSVSDPRLVMLCHGQINEMLALWKRPALDQELIQIFSKMFCPPQQRWTAHELLQLPFCQRSSRVFGAAVPTAFAARATTSDANETTKTSILSPLSSSSAASYPNSSNHGMDDPPMSVQRQSPATSAAPAVPAAHVLSCSARMPASAAASSSPLHTQFKCSWPSALQSLSYSSEERLAE